MRHYLTAPLRNYSLVNPMHVAVRHISNLIQAIPSLVLFSPKPWFFQPPSTIRYYQSPTPPKKSVLLAVLQSGNIQKHILGQPAATASEPLLLLRSATSSHIAPAFSPIDTVDSCPSP